MTSGSVSGTYSATSVPRNDLSLWASRHALSFDWSPSRDDRMADSWAATMDAFFEPWTNTSRMPAVVRTFITRRLGSASIATIRPRQSVLIALPKYRRTDP